MSETEVMVLDEERVNERLPYGPRSYIDVVERINRYRNWVDASLFCLEILKGTKDLGEATGKLNRFIFEARMELHAMVRERIMRDVSFYIKPQIP